MPGHRLVVLLPARAARRPAAGGRRRRGRRRRSGRSTASASRWPRCGTPSVRCDRPSPTRTCRGPTSSPPSRPSGCPTALVTTEHGIADDDLVYHGTVGRGPGSRRWRTPRACAAPTPSSRWPTRPRARCGPSGTRRARRWSASSATASTRCPTPRVATPGCTCARSPGWPPRSGSTTCCASFALLRAEHPGRAPHRGRHRPRGGGTARPRRRPRARRVDDLRRPRRPGSAARRRPTSSCSCRSGRTAPTRFSTPSCTGSAPSRRRSAATPRSSRLPRWWPTTTTPAMAAAGRRAGAGPGLPADAAGRLAGPRRDVRRGRRGLPRRRGPAMTVGRAGRQQRRDRRRRGHAARPSPRRCAPWATTVQVVAPRGGRDGVAEAARAVGFPATDLSSGRRQYVGELRAWRATNAAGILWCNGLVPAFATAGLATASCTCTRNRWASTRSPPGSPGAAPWSTLVPSESMAASVPGSRVLWNWVEPVTTHSRPSERTAERRHRLPRPALGRQGSGHPGRRARRARPHRPRPLPPAARGRGAVRPARGLGPDPSGDGAGRAPRRAARLDLPRGLLLVHRRRGLPVAVGRAVRARRRRGDVVAHAVRHLGRRGARRGGRPGPPVGRPAGGCRSARPRAGRRSSTPARTGWWRCSTARTPGGRSTSPPPRAWPGCRRLVSDLGVVTEHRSARIGPPRDLNTEPEADAPHATRTHHRDHRPGRPVPVRAPARQGLRGPRHHPRPEQPQARAGAGRSCPTSCCTPATSPTSPA